MIKIILFDVDNTLMDFNACARTAIQRAFEKEGLPYKEAVFEAFDRINEALWRRIEKGELTRAEHAKIRWQRIFDDQQIAADGPSFEPVFRQCLCETGVPNAGAAELLASLQGQYTLCVASNAPYAQQVSRLRNSGLLDFFDHLFISEKLGYTKPDPGFFEACFADLGDPEKTEILLVGDSLTADIAGGERCGIRTCWYNPSGAPCPAERHPTYTVSTLLEIRSILQA